MNKKIWIVAIILIVVTLVGWRIYGGSKQNGTIKIGAVLPLTGIAAAHGENERDGINLAVKEINMTGGIRGKQLQVVFEDDQTDPKNTVSAITKLITVDKAEVIIGGTWDFLANAAIPVIDQNHKILITPSALPDTLERSSPYLFDTHSPVAINERVAEKFLRLLTGKRIVVMAVNNPRGIAHANAFKKAIASTNSALIKEVDLPKFDNNDSQRELTLIRALNPDAILTALNFADDAAFVKRKTELGIRAKVLAEQKVDDMYQRGDISKELLKDFYVFRFSSPGAGFIERYQKEYHKLPQEYADTAYDAVNIVKLAVENADGKYDADSVKNGLHKINNYRGASGLINFTGRNYPENKQPVLEMFQGDHFVEVN